MRRNAACVALLTSSSNNGVIRTDGLNKPKGAEDKVRHYWRGLAESIGEIPFVLIVTGVVIAVVVDYAQSVKAGFAEEKASREKK